MGAVPLAFVIGLMKAHCLPLGWRAMKPYTHYLHSSGWILLGAGSSELTNRLSVCNGLHYGAAGTGRTDGNPDNHPARMDAQRGVDITALPRLAHMWAENRHRQFGKFLLAGHAAPAGRQSGMERPCPCELGFHRKILYHDAMPIRLG
ncbi:hypothetical protein [Komagataeibacter saccharivorans]|uniref:hypothetical protein n=1 Tax=Komagataeibacter saccharivorans TaxID=265959 RepID=UPI0011AFD10D|nr:hypothetical protein [Komagataeibacter saccharivorans]